MINISTSFLTQIELVMIFMIGLTMSCTHKASNPELGREKEEQKLYLGADLSYINEMEDCGGQFRKDGKLVDPFQLFAEQGSNIVRVRLWHTPDWTDYSTLEDVSKTIRRSKNAGMEILLDFHYSDNWADPGDQIIPLAWKGLSGKILEDSLYQYTYDVLMHLHTKDLMPEFVQVGNETNSELLLEEHVDELTEPINWPRNVGLLNAGLKAVRDASQASGLPIKSMVHVAQPEFVQPWLGDAQAAGLDDFDWLGISYYPLWSKYQIPEAASAIDSIIQTFKKPLMVVETAYPYVIENYDEANNILWDNAVLDAYPATPEGQLKYMIELTEQVVNGGGRGVIYWEPAWISTPCETRWGKGSHWENATFFDAANENEALPAFSFFDQNNYRQK